MDQLYAWLAGPLDNLARAGAPVPFMVVLAVVMFGSWTLTYFSTICKNFRDESYGIPFPNTCLNASWEAIFSFNLAGGLPPFAFPLQYGHLFWLLPNGLNIYQTYKFGPQVQTTPFLQKYFRWVFSGTFVAAFGLIFTYHFYARDVYGVASSWIINVAMSALFLWMLHGRRHDVMPDGTIRGMSLTAAKFKLLGNAAGAVFCFFWWPAQFAGANVQTVPVGDAALRVFMHNGMPVPEPPDYFFLYVLYAVNLALDVALIVMLRRREAEIRKAAETTATAVQFA
jgi:hypothetical protein